MEIEFIGLRKIEDFRGAYLIVKKPDGSEEKRPIPFKPYFYIESKEPSELRGVKGEYVRKIEVDKPSQVAREAPRYRKTFEADIPYVRRVTVDLGLRISDKAKVGFLDIEVDDSRGFPDPARDEIISIALIKSDGEEIWLNGEEGQIIRDFVKAVQDVSLLVGWNSGESWRDRAFDFPYLYQRALAYEIRLDRELWWIGLMDFMNEYKVTARPRSLRLDYVANVEFGEGKLDIGDRRVSDLSESELRDYNIQDAYLLKRLEEKYHFADGFLEKMRLAYQPIPTHGTIRLVDSVLLRKAKELDMVLPTAMPQEGERGYRGAIVLEPEAGVFRDVVFFDVDSLYPNVIINEGISPDFKGVLYPTTLRELLEKRFEYKRLWKETRKAEYYVKQYAYKILANAFYGVLGNPHFRLYDRSLAEAVTRRGREVLLTIKSYVEKLGFKVLYGDTDSIVVQISPKKAEVLARLINKKIAPYRVKVDKVFKAILFTGYGGKAVKKRYAGINDKGELEVVGLDIVRGDVFDLGKEFMENLIAMVLKVGMGEMSKEEVEDYIMRVRDELYSGKHDDKLVISKTLGNLANYKVDAPHVKVAKMLMESGINVYLLRRVEYVWIKKGKNTEPYPYMWLREGREKVRIDYDRYWQYILSMIDRVGYVIGLNSRLYKSGKQLTLGVYAGGK